ncbi:MAG: type II toxin-antitoxin system ParD family antitoxin [Planctomycetota bacterium]|nr:MAG: type II toxin-antitoxin system ParD family antitoxin [Planctomycetota bacterium]
MPTRNVNLTDHFDAFINAEVASGQYANASEVVRAGLRLLEHQKQEDERKLSKLRELAEVGFAQLDRGEGVSLNGREEIAAFLAEIMREVAERHHADDPVRSGS